MMDITISLKNKLFTNEKNQITVCIFIFLDTLDIYDSIFVARGTKSFLKWYSCHRMTNTWKQPDYQLRDES